MSPAPRMSSPVAGVPVSDPGSQLEDMFTHVMRCERWARFDDRLDLAYAVEKNRHRAPAGKVEEVNGGEA